MTQPTTDIWTSALAILHSHPRVTTLLYDFFPRLSHFGLAPAVEQIVVLLWAILDAAYIPFLLSLSWIIEPRLNLTKQGREDLHHWVYIWGGGVLLYKARAIFAAPGCYDLLTGPGPLLEKEAVCVFVALFLVVASGVLAAFLANFIFCAGTEGRESGSLYVVSLLVLCLGVVGFVFYPVVDEVWGGSRRVIWKPGDSWR